MSLSLDSNTEVPTPIMTDLQDIASKMALYMLDRRERPKA